MADVNELSHLREMLNEITTLQVNELKKGVGRDEELLRFCGELAAGLRSHITMALQSQGEL